jgi:hypothetical protein
VVVVILEAEFFIAITRIARFGLFLRKGNGKTNNYYLKMGE